MRKLSVSIPAVFFVSFCLNSQGTPQAQVPKPEDIQKNLVIVEKILPAIEKIKVGLESITAKDSLVLLSFISSDLLEGRETTTRGYELASDYAASLFALWKLKPAGDTRGMPRSPMMGMGQQTSQAAPQEKSFFQEFAMKEITDVSTQINLEAKIGELSKSRNFQSGVDFTGMSSAEESVSAPVVFAGYGITEKEIGYDDFKNLNVKGKIVLILSEAPGKDNPDSPFQQKKELKEKYFPAVALGPFARGGFSKAQEIAKLGAAAILQVQNSVKDSVMYKGMAGPRRVSDDRPIITEGRKRLSIPGAPDPMPPERSIVINITREMANAILEGAGQNIEDLQKKIETTLKPASLEVIGTRLTLTTTSKSTLVRCRNVIGFIEGSDPVLKNEVVVVGAHLDHLGKRGDYIFNGADDNGSGSVGVLNLARAFVTNPEKPKRTVLFCLWTGEEEGLLGSRYYVQNPVFPLEKTVAYINMDMISRPYDENIIRRMSRMFGVSEIPDLIKKIKPANFLPIIFAAGSGLADILRNADQYVGLDLYLMEVQATRGRGMGGSDHSSFASVNIPWIFCISAMTDDYHQTSDSIEKVSGETMERTSRLVYLAAYALADK